MLLEAGGELYTSLSKKCYDSGQFYYEVIMSIQAQIQQTIDNNAVVLFMKGTADFPQCGFSGKVVQILKACQADFKDVNVLSDDALRQGIKDFTSWPTIPQLYVRGEFIGGCDIVTQLFESGELQQMLQA
jgi:monothiol glutaredoxin